MTRQTVDPILIRDKREPTIKNSYEKWNWLQFNPVSSQTYSCANGDVIVFVVEKSSTPMLVQQSYIRFTLNLTFNLADAFVQFNGGFAGIFDKVLYLINNTTLEAAFPGRQHLSQLRYYLTTYTHEEEKKAVYGFSNHRTSDGADFSATVLTTGSRSELITTSMFTRTSLAATTYSFEVQVPVSDLVDFYRTFDGPLYGMQQRLELTLPQSLTYFYTSLNSAITAATITNVVWEIPTYSLTSLASRRRFESLKRLNNQIESVKCEEWRVYPFSIPVGSTEISQVCNIAGWNPSLIVLAGQEPIIQQSTDGRNYPAGLQFTEVILEVNGAKVNERDYTMTSGSSTTFTRPFHDYMTYMCPVERGRGATPLICDRVTYASSDENWVKTIFVWDMTKKNRGMFGKVNSSNVLTFRLRMPTTGAVLNMYGLVKYERAQRIRYMESEIAIAEVPNLLEHERAEMQITKEEVQMMKGAGQY